MEMIKSRIQEKLKMAPSINALIMLDFGNEGALYIDATQNPATMSEESSSDPDVALISTKDNFQKILDGSLDPNIAFMMGRLKVRGSMKLALKLSAVLEE